MPKDVDSKKSIKSKVVVKTRGLAIRVTPDLIEELLKKHVKNVPEDLKFDSVGFHWFEQELRFYFRSKEFPIIKDNLKVNAIAGRIEVTTNKKGKITRVELKWRDPEKEKPNGH